MSVTRRDFIKKSATTVAVGLAVPPWLAKMVWADSVADNALTTSGLTSGRSLVVIQPHRWQRRPQHRGPLC